MMRKDKKTEAPSCDWTHGGNGPVTGRGAVRPGRTRLHRHGAEYTWSGVKTERYKAEDGTWSDVLRRTLVGNHGEDTKFHLRYFEVAPGGHTTLEQHRHEHVVVGVRGRGKCLVRNRIYEVGFMDTLYIPPHAPHQIQNPYTEPFGFFCIVDAKRDKPKPLGMHTG